MSDEDRYRDIYRSTYPLVVAYCRRRLPIDAVEDAVAQVFTVGWDKRDQLFDADSALAWLYAVGFRVVSAQYRRSNRLRSLRQRVADAPKVPVPGVDDVAEARAEMTAAFAALQSLRLDDQELIRLAAFEGLSIAEIARVTGRTEAGARSALFRARERLRRSFDAQGVP